MKFTYLLFHQNHGIFVTDFLIIAKKYQSKMSSYNFSYVSWIIDFWLEYWIRIHVLLCAIHVVCPWWFISQRSPREMMCKMLGPGKPFSAFWPYGVVHLMPCQIFGDKPLFKINTELLSTGIFEAMFSDIWINIKKMYFKMVPIFVRCQCVMYAINYCHGP